MTAIVLTTAVLISWLVLSDQSDAPRFHPSAYPAYIPQPDDSFQFYLEENRKRIRSALNTYYYAQELEPFGEGLPLETVLEMRSPFQYLPEEDCADAENRVIEEATKGFLLVHGLTDSPYLLRSIAGELHTEFPCAFIQALLSPGHSTVPGDLLNVRLEQWQATFDWGVANLNSQADEVTVLGYSNGSALALNFLNSNITDPFNSIDRLVLISPGLKPADGRAYLTPYLKYLQPWLNKHEDRDAVKYESFPTNAAAEFYKLTKRVTAADAPILKTPTLMIVSGDDTTIDASAAADLFCNKLSAPEKKLIWLQSSSPESQLPQNCEGTEAWEHTSDNKTERVASLSHVALSIPSSDLHYGIDGRYPVCLAHADFPTRLSRCLDDKQNSIYGESNFLDQNGEYNGAIVRRTSFNPRFDDMMLQINCFIRNNCSQ
tara:strand:+ start:9357 stop:10652 length:1296 start_codon:yes stop_codon:yes gene_type:complete